jgi:hypothetical protein
MMMTKRNLWTIALALGPLACGDASEPIPNGANGDGANGGAGGNGDDGAALIETIDEGGGVFATQVDASDQEAWVYFDLDASARVEVDDVASSTDWDLAFRRSNVKVNGGYSGPDDVAVAVLPEVAFDGLDQAPVALFESDAPSSDEVDPDRPSFIDDDGTDFVFGRANAASNNGWYVYDPINHVLSATDATFVVRSTEGAYFKLRFLDYYNAAGSAGFPTFRWAEVAPPPGPQSFSVDASSREAFAYIALEDGQAVDVSDPTSSADWDLAFRRTLVRTNSGISGPGWGGAREDADAMNQEVEAVDTIGFHPDALVPPPGPPVPVEQWQPANEILSNWFDYDPATRTVTPRATRFFVRDAEGDKYALGITDWEDGRFDLEVVPVPPKPDIRSVTIDAPASAWTYFDARVGEVVEIEDPATSLAWDLAFRGAEVRTNGGGSGPGDASVAPVDAALEDVVRVPEDGFEADVGGTNPALASWSEEQSVFVLTLADGTFAKLRVVRADGEQWEVDYAYAGPGRRSFR